MSSSPLNSPPQQAAPGPDLVHALNELEAEALRALAQTEDAQAVEELRIRYLGRKEGRISGILRGLGNLPPEARPRVGAEANRVRSRVEAAIEEASARVVAAGSTAAGSTEAGSTEAGSTEAGGTAVGGTAAEIAAARVRAEGPAAGTGPRSGSPDTASTADGEGAGQAHGAGARGDEKAPPTRGAVPSSPSGRQQAAAGAGEDLTLPGRHPFRGGRHPITLVVDELWEIFRGMGFTRARGPEAETEWYNFEALNTPLDHPAADEQDTLYLKGGNLLRSHTSPVQVRVMEAHRPPIRILAPGMVYRRDTYDATHAPAFLQLEGLVIDEGVTFVDLKATLAEFARRYWGPGTRIRFRPSFFPFTEPSAEVDVKRIWTDADGVEQETDWLEIMGAGMVDPAVLEAAGIDPERYSGFAFGMGPGRIGMLKYGIPDIRAFFENDVRFLSQFSR